MRQIRKELFQKCQNKRATVASILEKFLLVPSLIKQETDISKKVFLQTLFDIYDCCTLTEYFSIRQTCERTFWGDLLWSIFVKMKSKPTIFCRTCQRRTFSMKCHFRLTFHQQTFRIPQRRLLLFRYLTLVLLLTSHKRNFLNLRRPYM